MSPRKNRIASRRHLLLALPGSLLALALKSALLCSPSFAASQLAFEYGPLEESISVKNLRTYIETKKAPPDIKNLLSLIGSKNEKKLQGFAQQKFSLNVVAVDKLLNSDAGKEILSELTKVTVRRDNAGIQAVRAALVLASVSPDGFGLLSFLEAYPSQELKIDVTQLPKLFRFIADNQTRLQFLGFSLLR